MALNRDRKKQIRAATTMAKKGDGMSARLEVKYLWVEPGGYAWLQVKGIDKPVILGGNPEDSIVGFAELQKIMRQVATNAAKKKSLATT